jgi:hypothetical protein
MGIQWYAGIIQVGEHGAAESFCPADRRLAPKMSNVVVSMRQCACLTGMHRVLSNRRTGGAAEIGFAHARILAWRGTRAAGDGRVIAASPEGQAHSDSNNMLICNSWKGAPAEWRAGLSSNRIGFAA